MKPIDKAIEQVAIILALDAAGLPYHFASEDRNAAVRVLTAARRDPGIPARLAIHAARDRARRKLLIDDADERYVCGSIALARLRQLADGNRGRSQPNEAIRSSASKSRSSASSAGRFNPFSRLTGDDRLNQFGALSCLHLENRLAVLRQL